MYFYNDYVNRILSHYQEFMPLEDTIPIGFTGVASQRVAPVFSNEIAEDSLIFAAGVDFTTSQATEARVRISSVSPVYDWMANIDELPQDTPVGTLAGVIGTAMPVIALPMPFFIQRQGKVRLQFTNAIAAPITGGNWTFRGLRLTRPINGGWSYAIGFGN